MNPIGFGVAAALGNVVGALAVVRHERRSLRVIDACLAARSETPFCAPDVRTDQALVLSKVKACASVCANLRRGCWR